MKKRLPGALLLLIVLCANLIGAPFSMPREGAVRLVTEQKSYPSGTRGVKLYWENHGTESALYGTSWELERLEGLRWRALPVRDGEQGVIRMDLMIGIVLPAGETRQELYRVEAFVPALTPGLYRIRTWYGVGENARAETRVVTKPFRVRNSG